MRKVEGSGVGGVGVGGVHAIQVLSRTPPGSIETMFSMLFWVTSTTHRVRAEYFDSKRK